MAVQRVKGRETHVNLAVYPNIRSLIIIFFAGVV
jgi:hypothetical protein